MTVTFGKKCPSCGYINQPDEDDCYLCERGDLRDVFPARHAGPVPRWATTGQTDDGTKDVVGAPEDTSPSLRRKEATTSEDHVGCFTMVKYASLGIAGIGLLAKVILGFAPQNLPACSSTEISTAVHQIIGRLDPAVEFAVGEIKQAKKPTDSGERVCQTSVVIGDQRFPMRVIVNWTDQEAGKYQVQLKREEGP